MGTAEALGLPFEANRKVSTLPDQSIWDPIDGRRVVNEGSLNVGREFWAYASEAIPSKAAAVHADIAVRCPIDGTP